MVAAEEISPSPEARAPLLEAFDLEEPLPEEQNLERVAPAALDPAVRAHWEAIYIKYCQMVWRTLRRIGYSPDTAAEAAQQAFLICVQRAADVRTGLEKAFLFSTAIRVAKRMLQKERRLELLPDPEQSSLLVTGAHDERHHALLVFDQILQKMDEDLSAIFVLFELEELSSREIAEWLNIPIGTVASRLRRARARFRELTDDLEPGLGWNRTRTRTAPGSQEDE